MSPLRRCLASVLRRTAVPSWQAPLYIHNEDRYRVSTFTTQRPVFSSDESRPATKTSTLCVSCGSLVPSFLPPPLFSTGGSCSGVSNNIPSDAQKLCLFDAEEILSSPKITEHRGRPCIRENKKTFPPFAMPHMKAESTRDDISIVDRTPKKIKWMERLLHSNEEI